MHYVQLPKPSCVKDHWIGRPFEACTCHALCTRKYHGTKSVCTLISWCLSGYLRFLVSCMLFTGLCLHCSVLGYVDPVLPFIA